MRTALHFARIGHLLLLVVTIGGLVWKAPADAPAAATAIMTLIYAPLVLFLPATLSGDRRLLTWFCFLLLVYFCGFVMQAVEPPPERTLALLRIGVLSALFVACVFLIRGERKRDDD